MKRRILVVDDEMDMLLVVRAALEQGGYDVVTASNGHDALAQVKAQPPHLILMDVSMPQLDGFETTRLLKADEATAGIPIVILTASGEFADMEQGWEAGIDLYLKKPFKPAELIDYIHSILED